MGFQCRKLKGEWDRDKKLDLNCMTYYMRTIYRVNVSIALLLTS